MLAAKLVNINWYHNDAIAILRWAKKVKNSLFKPKNYAFVQKYRWDSWSKTKTWAQACVFKGKYSNNK